MDVYVSAIIPELITQTQLSKPTYRILIKMFKF